MSFNRVDDFLAKLSSQQPKVKSESFQNKNRTLEKIYLNHPSNFGRYMMLPFDSVVTDYPFVTLFNTRELQMSRKNLTADGQENIYKAWIKLLPRDAYTRKDETGRLTSSLTKSDEDLLSQAYQLYDQLAEELDARNSRDPHVIGLLRKRNYTIWHARVVNKWAMSDSRTVEREGFSALFVCTAKNFVNNVMANIEEKRVMEGGDASWISNIYNRNLTNRDGFLMFSISDDPSRPGYATSAQHEFGRAKLLEGVVTSAEDAELMADPVASFLGWQAKRNDEGAPAEQRCLFNAVLIREAVEFMGQQLGAIRMAKSQGMDVAEAIERTTAAALANQPVTTTNGQATNDPMLAQMAAAEKTFTGGTANTATITENNTNPYQTPPVAHIDPLTSAPTNGGATFDKPDFAGFGGGNGSDLPF